MAPGGAIPEPRRILEIEPITWLLDRGAVVICAGGGGIPTIAPDRGAGGSTPGIFSSPKPDAHSGNNGRAAILNNTEDANLYYTSGNAGNGSTPQPDGIIRCRRAGPQAEDPTVTVAMAWNADARGELQYYAVGRRHRR